MSKLSDEAQGLVLGKLEPTFVLRASDPLSGMMVRFWANANQKTLDAKTIADARALAATMDLWRSAKDRGMIP